MRHRVDSLEESVHHWPRRSQRVRNGKRRRKKKVMRPPPWTSREWQNGGEWKRETLTIFLLYILKWANIVHCIAFNRSQLFFLALCDSRFSDALTIFRRYLDFGRTMLKIVFDNYWTLTFLSLSAYRNLDTKFTTCLRVFPNVIACFSRRDGRSIWSGNVP